MLKWGFYLYAKKITKQNKTNSPIFKNAYSTNKSCLKSSDIN